MLLRNTLPVILLCGWVFGQTAANVPVPLSSIVTRMEAAQAAKRDSGAYQVIRSYRVSGEKSSAADSQVVAAVTFAPPSTRSYTIQKTTGSGRGEQVVRRILDQETQASDKQMQAASVTSDNYDFAYVGEAAVDGQRCYRLGLHPKRRDKSLVTGEALVDQRTFQVRSIEGDLAKTPSWWLKKVHVRMAFADVQGTWLETNMQAVAEVRIFGPHTLTSELVDYRGADVVAMRSGLKATGRSLRNGRRKADPAYSAVFTR